MLFRSGRVLGVVNAVGSAIARECDGGLYLHAGPEVAVASTKAFLTQIIAAYLVGLYLAQARGTMFEDEIRAVLGELDGEPEQLVVDSERDQARVVGGGTLVVVVA